MIRILSVIAIILFLLLPKQVTHCKLFEHLTPHIKGGRLNFTSLATKFGHPSIQYDVVTEDGYILTLFRIPGKSRIPVLVVHGILESSDDWLLRGKDSLAIALAKDGYDVWCANTRGNRYSRRHISLDPDTDPKFWDFSFNEVGYYDIPAIIDTILNETHARSISAIGHSQGTNDFFVLGATRPEYNKKINVMLALAPEAYLHHCPPPMSLLIRLSPWIENIIKDAEIYEALGDTRPVTQLLRLICPIPVFGYEVCVLGIIFPFTGYDVTELEPSFYSKIADYFPAGTSSKSLLHFLQLGRRKTFAKYDYGPNMNLIIYNSTEPTQYDLSKVSMPIALFAAENDHLSTLPDVVLLREQLPNVVYNLVNPRKLFNHADYVVGKHMRNYLFPYIFEILEQYSTK